MIAPPASLTPRSLTECGPDYVCPGTYVHRGVPFGLISEVAQEHEAALSSSDRDTLRIRGYAQFSGRPVTPPREWSGEKQQIALNWMKLRSELAGRAHAPEQYRPWTADVICRACPDWTGSNKWSWRGVRGIQPAVTRGISVVPLPWDYPRFVVTCGMLRDAGVISSPEGCEAEKASAMQAYVQHLQALAEHRARRRAKTAMAVGITLATIQIVTSVIATTAAGPAGAAVATGLSSTIQIMQAQMDDGQIDAKEALTIAVTTITGIVTAYASAIGPVATATAEVMRGAAKVALEAEKLIETLEAQKKQREAIRAIRSRLEGQMAELAALLEAREELSVINDLIRRMESEIARGKAEIGSRSRTAIGLGLVLLAAVAALSRRRG